MKNLFLMAAIALCAAQPLGAQHFTVEGVRQLKVDAPQGMFHPVFTPDGKTLLVSAEDYVGLQAVDLEKQTVRTLSTAEGAGYKIAFADQGATVVTRQNNLMDQTMSLYAIDLEDGSQKLLIKDAPHTNTVTLTQGSLNYARNGRLTVQPIATRRFKAPAQVVEDEIFLTEEDLKMVLYKNGERIVIDPLSNEDRDVNYCWSSLSPDKTRIAFVAGKYAYTCNIDGTGLQNIGDLRAPVWRDNNYVVGMEDKDDGHVITASDIVIVDRTGEQFQKLTDTADAQIKMFPAVSPDGNQIAYHTTDGKIFILTIAEK